MAANTSPPRRRTRDLFLTIHRFTGFAIVLFLVVAGLTGTVLVFDHELDTALNPHLFRAAPPIPGAQMLDPFELRERVAAQVPGGEFRNVVFDAKNGEAIVGEIGEGEQVFINSYDGRVLGYRTWGDLSEGLWLNLMPFILRLHYSLALGDVGVWLFGIASLLWTFDCFVGAYLTFPAAQKRKNAENRKSWLQRWLPSWLMKTGQLFSTIFTFHRAAGLWLWALLLVFAWSAVGFNLQPVYKPVMSAFGYQSDDHEGTPLQQPLTTPALDWRAAHAQGQKLMQLEATERNFVTKTEGSLYYDPGQGHYTYGVHSSLDISPAYAGTSVTFDGNTGKLASFYAPSGLNTANTVHNWLVELHLVGVGGLPYRLLIACLGLLIPTLAVSGIWIWWRKRQPLSKKGALSQSNVKPKMQSQMVT